MGFLVEEGRGVEKLVIVSISLNIHTESLLDGWTGNSNDGFVYIFIVVGAEHSGSAGQPSGSHRTHSAFSDKHGRR